MARPGVSFSEVDRAARRVLEQGQRPTVDRVIAITGGSRTTVNAHLKLWWAKHDQQVDAEQAGLPSHLVEAVKALNEKAHETAEQKIMEARTRFEAEAARLRQEASEHRTHADQLTKQLQALQEQLKQRASDNESLKQALDNDKLLIARLEMELASTKSVLEETRDNLRERQAENRDIRNHFEHYQLKIAEDRQHEREQFRSTRASLEQQVDLMNKQLQSAEQRRLAAEAKCTDLLSLKTHSDTVHQELEQSLSAAAAQNASLQQVVAQQEQTMLQWNQTLQNIMDQHQHLQKEHLLVCQQKSAQDQQMKHWEQQSKECLDRASVLSDENRILLQEKTMLQGQLRQLQNSL